ncbi:MAG: SO2930 family diheme c-type cytochrome [Myxococcota bacterium]
MSGLFIRRSSSSSGIGKVAWLLTAMSGLAACGDENKPGDSRDIVPGFGPVSITPGEPPSVLSEFNLVRMQEGAVVTHPELWPYDLNTPLFSDYTIKQRAIYVPDGEAMGYDADEVFDFPIGSAIVKTFLYPEDLRAPGDGLRPIETRVLLRADGGWESYPYRWRDNGSDAEYQPGGSVESLEFVGNDGEPLQATYAIPQQNACGTCHRRADDEDEQQLTPIGPQARHLNRQTPTGFSANAQDGAESNADTESPNQLAHWAEAGILTELPSETGAWPRAAVFEDDDAADLENLSDAELNALARSYLDINCAHCHNPRGVQGVSSQLFLNIDNESSSNLGICKRPGSAGRGTGGFEFDIVPGSADTSIMVFRLETDDPGAAMPPLGRSLIHREGARLIRAWIDRMPPASCSPEGAGER